MTFTHTLTLSRTGEARAPLEVHGLHAFGEHDLVDSTCGKKGKVRNEEAVRLNRKNLLNKNMTFNHTLTRPYL